jgi:hypothetical protein
LEEIGMMRTRTGWRRWLLAVGLALAPAAAWGQDSTGYSRPDPVWPLPLYHDRPERGGLYAAAEFLFMRQSNPLQDQVVATRGFVDNSGDIQRALNVILFNDLNNQNIPVVPGKQIGSGDIALRTDQVTGPNSYQPGIGLTLGWRLQGGGSVEFAWRHVQDTRLSAVASVLGPTLSTGYTGVETLLTSPVFNFPPDFAGPQNKVNITTGNGIVPLIFVRNLDLTTGLVTGLRQNLLAGQTSNVLVVPGDPYGIWNGAAIMTISFMQRWDDFNIIGRFPVYQDDLFRCYGIAGGRAIVQWERFQWRTTSLNLGDATDVHIVDSFLAQQGFDPGSLNNQFRLATLNTSQVGPEGGLTGPQDVAIYSNIVSNRMYGPTFGGGCEWYLGAGFALGLDVRGSAFLDIVKEEAKYERADRFIAAKRSTRDYTFVPEIFSNLNLWWYPIEGVEIRFGYNVDLLFNTVSSPKPIDFNYGSLTPGYDKGTFRMLDGWNAGIGFIF